MCYFCKKTFVFVRSFAQFMVDFADQLIFFPLETLRIKCRGYLPGLCCLSFWWWRHGHQKITPLYLQFLRNYEILLGFFCDYIMSKILNISCMNLAFTPDLIERFFCITSTCFVNVFFWYLTSTTACRRISIWAILHIHR